MTETWIFPPYTKVRVLLTGDDRTTPFIFKGYTFLNPHWKPRASRKCFWRRFSRCCTYMKTSRPLGPVTEWGDSRTNHNITPIPASHLAWEPSCPWPVKWRCFAPECPDLNRLTAPFRINTFPGFRFSGFGWFYSMRHGSTILSEVELRWTLQFRGISSAVVREPLQYGKERVDHWEL